MQHYAVKTIENVVSQGGEWAARSASEEVAADLLSIWVTNRRCVLHDLWGCTPDGGHISASLSVCNLTTPHNNVVIYIAAFDACHAVAARL